MLAGAITSARQPPPAYRAFAASRAAALRGFARPLTLATALPHGEAARRDPAYDS